MKNRAFRDRLNFAWSGIRSAWRSEASLRTTCLDDLGCAAYYTGTLLDAPEELPDVIGEVLSQG